MEKTPEISCWDIKTKFEVNIMRYANSVRHGHDIRLSLSSMALRICR